MTSKWIDGDLFGEFQQKKKDEKDKPQGGGVFRSEIVWKTPEKGTIDTPKVYEGRFITDKNGRFYEKYYYHMFKSGESWIFILCPKTFDFECFCPFCTASQKLYMGTTADKKRARDYSRKEKFVGNFYIIDDPRDNEVQEDEDKVDGTIKLYEFPGKIENKLKEEITDTKNGLGIGIFDPGKDGHNFILKVLSTKRDKEGKVWPDYSNSMFSRRSSALGTDKEIDAIMKQTYDLGEYIEGMRKDDSEIIEILKKEVIWDLVKDEWNRAHSKVDVLEGKKEDDIDDSIWDKENTDDGDETAWNDDTESDEQLLRELDEL